MAIDFKNAKSVLNGIFSLFKTGNVNTNNLNIPTPLIILGGKKKHGLSPIKIASNIIKRKPEAGLPVGTLPDGQTNPDEIMERIRVEEIVKALQQDAVITVAIPPGASVQANGLSPSGPVTVYGATITIHKGYAQIQ